MVSNVTNYKTLHELKQYNCLQHIDFIHLLTGADSASTSIREAAGGCRQK